MAALPTVAALVAGKRTQASDMADGWLSELLAGAEPGLAILPAIMLVGLVGAVGSCCNMGVLASVAGFTGSTQTQHDGTKGNLRITAIAFVGGTVVALATLGIITGLIGQTLGNQIGHWWTLAAGLIMVTFGLVALDWLPFRVPTGIDVSRVVGTTRASSAIFGLSLGGGQVACSSACACNPAMLVALAFALQGDVFWSASVMTAYAVGFSLPLGAVLAGMRFGMDTISRWRDYAMPLFRRVGGAVLIGMGFYLLVSARAAP